MPRAPGGVEFLSETLFRAHVPVPAGVPRGQYNVEVYLFRDGTGDQRAVDAAVHRPDRAGAAPVQFRARSPLAYGLPTVLMAMLLGWLSSLLFRRLTRSWRPRAAIGIDALGCPACRRAKAPANSAAIAAVAAHRARRHRHRRPASPCAEPSEAKQRRRRLRPRIGDRGAGMQMARDLARLGHGARLMPEDQTADAQASP